VSPPPQKKVRKKDSNYSIAEYCIIAEVRKKYEKKVQKKVQKIIIKNYKLLEGGEGTGGWRIVIPMPESLNCVKGRRQKTKTKFINKKSLIKNHK
jgi:hypothetical protein